MQLHHRGTFEAVDENGKRYTLHRYVERGSISTLSNPGAMADNGLIEVRNEKGETLEYLEKGRYQLSSGLILTSNDPNAP